MMSHDADDGTLHVRAPIVLFIPGLEGGGAQRVFVNLANTLVDLTPHPVILLVLRRGGVFEKDLRPEVEVVNLASGRVSRSVPALTQYLRKVHPQVLCSTLNYCNVAAVAAWCLAGRPCRLVVREANVLNSAGRLMRFLMRWTYPLADGVVALSPEIRNTLIQSGIAAAEKVVEIGNPGVFEVLPKKLAPPEFLPLPLPKFICAVGRLYKQKGFDNLLEAFAGLTNESLHLVILGEGPQRSELEAKSVALSIDGRVHMPGFISKPMEVVAQAELFVLSSRWEGFPNVLLEALWTGTPVVACNGEGAMRTILENGKHGHLVLPEDPNALREGIQQALSLPRGAVDTRKARALDFSADKVVSAYLKKAFCLPLQPN